MNDQELIRRIRLGEDGGLELKAVHFSGNKIAGPKRNELADEMAAFAKFGRWRLGLGGKRRDPRSDGDSSGTT